MTADLQATRGKTDLALSASWEVPRQDDRTAAARFEDLLELRSRAAARGYHDLAEAYTDRIVDEVLSDSFGLSGPGGHAA